MISVHNFDEKNTLLSLAMNNQYDPSFNTWDISACWIGLHRKNFVLFVSFLKIYPNKSLYRQNFFQLCPESFVWSDNSSVDYKDFLSSEPDCRNNKQHCVDVVHVNPDPSFYAIVTGWDDVECHIQMKSVCKLSLERNTQTLFIINSFQTCEKAAD